LRERAFQVAASSALGDAEEIAKSVAALRTVAPDFDAERFVSSLPYEDEGDRHALRDALVAVAS
jgi:hypothetical protein